MGWHMRGAPSTKEDHMPAIRLSTIGSRSISLDVGPAALPGAEGGVALWVRGLYRGEHAAGTSASPDLAIILTAGEAEELVLGIEETVDAYMQGLS
jgi:hypothetical protein